MIEETVFTEKDLIQEVKKNYNINVYQVEKLNRGSANLYSINDNKYILKEFQSKYTKAEIEKEINIINQLKKKEIPVPTYIKTIDNSYCFSYKERIITLQEYIEGYTLESNTGNYNQMIESAEYLGKIIKNLQDLDFELPENDISDWYSLKTINESIEKQKNLLKKISENEYPQIYKDLSDKIDMLENIKKIDFSNMNKITLMNTHGDYSLLQFIYKDGNINAIIDFVSACKMPIVWEIIRSYSYIDEKAKDGTIDIPNLVQYVKKVAEYVDLSKYDLIYMPYLYMIQLLTSTFGYKQYIADNSKKSLLDFAYFRTKLCKFLYNNAEKISNALENELL